MTSGPTRQGEIWTVETVTRQRYSVIVIDPDMLAESRPVISAVRVIEAREVLTPLSLLSMTLPDGRVVVSYSLVTIARASYVELEATLTGEALGAFRVLLGHRFDL
ncbi:MAG: hypothetical protein JWN03_7017 [Nocardia sp.]|uniref:hypothetical protein n=1 Tax=Nocardia sp. TaxID=1821 RepID=UPI00261CF998|nr:hypothetical protein [Nocardia sp.]MCU1646742.1 hypothetical protein [Nocardia sp.]